MRQLFFNLVKVSLGLKTNLVRNPSESEWIGLFDMAKKQSVVGICFAALNKLGASSTGGCIEIGISEKLFFDWLASTVIFQQRNETIDGQCIELQKKLSDAGLSSCLLKGQSVAALYGNLSNLRQPGDIDMWVDGGIDSVMHFVSLFEKVEKLDNKHLHLHYFPDTEVELHWTPIYWYSSSKNSVLQSYFEAERERQFSNIVNGICVPTVDFQLVHQMLHMFGHYMYEGVGLRQLMDLFFTHRAFYMKFNREDDTNKKVTTLFVKLGLMRFVAATQWAMHEVFDLPCEQMFCKPDEKEGNKLLDEIMTGGNFGHYDKRNYMADKSLVQRFLHRWGRQVRMFRFDPLGTLFMPFSRLKLEFWMWRVRKRRNVDNLK